MFVQGSTASQSESPSLSGRWASAGQVVATPSHVSATSQAPTAARQTVPAFPAGCWHVGPLPPQTSLVQIWPSSVQGLAGANTSWGQAALEPVHVSATSHSPADARHTVVPGRKPSAGHASEMPSHASATSHGPAAGRQTAALLASAGQATLTPVQNSAGSQTPALARHTTLDGWSMSAGQLVATPSQTSTASQGPAADRQTVPGFPAGC